MRKFLTILFIIFIASNNAVFAEGDLWDNFGDSNIYGQKPVSDKEFEQALESKKGKKKRDKNIPKGESFSQSNETEQISNTAKELPVLLIPLNLKVNNASIPVGHYQVEGFKENGQTFLKLYQAHDVIAKIPATETNDDFDEPTINFVKLIPHGQTHVQIIYGGIDFNAYSIIDIDG
ncbi:unknown [Fusobacterium sp. CAG:439]|nr:unknown [Fusobacterium sp. CAG:439]